MEDLSMDPIARDGKCHIFLLQFQQATFYSYLLKILTPMAEQIPGAGLPEGINLVRGTYNLWVLSMELVSYQPPGILNFELAPRFSENLCTPADALSQRLHRHMQLTNKIKKKIGM